MRSWRSFIFRCVGRDWHFASFAALQKVWPLLGVQQTLQPSLRAFMSSRPSHLESKIATLYERALSRMQGLEAGAERA
jgi:hypothetical protein